MTAPTIAEQTAAFHYVLAHFRDIRSTFPDIEVALSKDALAAGVATLEAQPAMLAVIEAARELVTSQHELGRADWDKTDALTDLLATFPPAPEETP